MPSDSGYVFDFDTVQRIAKAVRDFERGVEKPGINGLESNQLKSGESYIQITGGRATPGYYDGVEKVFRTDTGGWQYSATSCIAWEVNAGVLVIGETYKGTIKTCGENGKTVFAVQAGGATDNTIIKPRILQIMSWDATTPFYMVSECSHNGTSWVCGTNPGQYAIEINNLVLEIGRRYIGVTCGTKNGKNLYGIQTWWGVVTDVNCDATGLHQTKREI